MFGDLILWNQIIAKAASSPEYKYIIFITDDNKPDWVWTADTNGVKSRGARPELIEEMAICGGGMGFILVNVGFFLLEARTRLKVNVDEETIKQSHDIARPELPSAARIDEAFMKWVREWWTIEELIPTGQMLPFYGLGNPRTDAGGSARAFGYVAISQIEDANRLLASAREEVEALVSEGYGKINVCVIITNHLEIDASELIRISKRWLLDMRDVVTMAHFWISNPNNETNELNQIA